MGMYLVSRHDDLQTILRAPITFSQELGYYKQMANGHLDEMKEILERAGGGFFPRSEEPTSELQSLMRLSYAVFCLTNQHYTKRIKTLIHQLSHHITSTDIQLS